MECYCDFFFFEQGGSNFDFFFKSKLGDLNFMAKFDLSAS